MFKLLRTGSCCFSKVLQIILLWWVGCLRFVTRVCTLGANGLKVGEFWLVEHCKLDPLVEYSKGIQKGFKRDGMHYSLARHSGSGTGPIKKEEMKFAVLALVCFLIVSAQSADDLSVSISLAISVLCFMLVVRAQVLAENQRQICRVQTETVEWSEKHS